MNNQSIKVGYLISYDYRYLKYSLPTIYPYADEITLALDKDGKTWKGGDMLIPGSFFHWIKEYDTENKIKVYTDSFYEPTLSVMECDTRERNMLAKAMGHGGWHIQIDSDEYFFNFRDFIEYIKTLDYNKETLIYAEWVTIFKQDGINNFIINSNENFPLATNNPSYKFARHIKTKNNIYTKFKVLHQSWGRTEDELKQKLNNWGHTSDFDINSYFNFWKSIDKDNFKYIKNFHPLNPIYWKSLEHIEASDIPALITKVKEMEANKETGSKKKSLWSFFKTTD